MYAGLAPAQALSIYAVITYLDCVSGVYFPMGGMHAVPRALAGAAAKHGVQFRYGTEVAGVEIRAGRARGVRTTDGELIAADVVVMNADLPVAYERLLPGARLRDEYGGCVTPHPPSCCISARPRNTRRPHTTRSISARPGNRRSTKSFDAGR